MSCKYIYNSAGQEVDMINTGYQEAGYHSIEWKPCKLSSGIYHARISYDGFKKDIKMMYIK
jgi:hypothetical protein